MTMTVTMKIYTMKFLTPIITSLEHMKQNKL